MKTGIKRKTKKYLAIVVLALLFVALFAVVSCSPSPNASSEPAVADDSALVPPAWTVDSDCASCHTAEAAGATDTTCGYAIHSSQPGLTCTSCHLDTNGALTQAHSDYTSAQKPTALKKTTVTSDACTASGCHDDTALRIAGTATLKALTDDNGLTVNPHDIPVSDGHADITCTSCHTMHMTGFDLDQHADQMCIGCHHAGVFECGTCHDAASGG
ncbi:MAG: hypothetical protein FWD72_02290 [Eggerthellaceae bacterium]|nr:hypothetical protein [Eggerthellaceae bacterium]